jgi:Multicopper oxidase
MMSNGLNQRARMCTTMEAPDTKWYSPLDKSHRIRLINTAIDTVFKVMLDSYTITAAVTDFNSIRPIITDIITIGIAQQYGIIINADQNASDLVLGSATDYLRRQRNDYKC